MNLRGASCDSAPLLRTTFGILGSFCKDWSGFHALLALVLTISPYTRAIMSFILSSGVVANVAKVPIVTVHKATLPKTVQKCRQMW